MADATLIYGAAAAVGGALVAGSREVWAWFRKRADGETVAKDETIAVLKSESAQKDRSILRLGERLDSINDQLEKERLKTLGVALRMRMDSSVHEEDFEADMPTAVRDRLEIVAPKTPSLPPSTKQALREYVEKTPTDPHPIIPPHRQGKR